MAEFNQGIQPLTSLANQFADLQVQSHGPQGGLILNLPNLRVNRIYVARTLPRRVEFAARIANDGIRDSGPFKVLWFVTRDGQQSQTTGQEQNLPAQTTRDLTLALDGEEGVVETICLRVWLDPPTPEHPGGEVLEANNLDNLFPVLGAACFDVQFPPSI